MMPINGPARIGTEIRQRGSGGRPLNNAHWHYKKSQDMDDLKVLLLKNWKNLTPILKHLNLLGRSPFPYCFSFLMKHDHSSKWDSVGNCKTKGSVPVPYPPAEQSDKSGYRKNLLAFSQFSWIQPPR